MRLNGASYEQVARAGGGIVSTVSATRSESEAGLLKQALVRADALIAEGVSTIEIKSGYGLDCDTELKMLRVAREIGRARPITVITSFLGAHAVPVGADADDYSDTVCLPTLEKAHAQGLVDAVDGFCEAIAFSPAQIERVFAKARDLGLADRGAIAPGLRADLAVWDAAEPAELSYRFGVNPLHRRIHEGLL